MSQAHPPISGIILAGGLARRMQGQDKGLTLLDGKPMIEYVIAAMRSQVDELMINANRNLETYSQYGFQVCPDQIPGYAGPLAGIAAGMESASHELLLTAPCDGPWLPPDLGKRLLSQLQAEDADLCIVHDGTRLQPVYGLFRCDLHDGIRNFLATGERKLKRWLDQQKLAVADFSDHPQAFTNVNTPEERERLEQSMSQR